MTSDTVAERAGGWEGAEGASMEARKSSEPAGRVLGKEGTAQWELGSPRRRVGWPQRQYQHSLSKILTKQSMR